MARKTKTSKAARIEDKSTIHRKRVTFTVPAEPGSTVGVSGTFNNWDPVGTAMTDKNNDGNYTVTMLLSPGVYEYKFIVNGTWSVDPNCSEWVQNSLGTLNSVLRV